MKWFSPKLNALDLRLVFSVLGLLLIVFYFSLSSLQSILWSAPFLALGASLSILVALYYKEMLSTPWVLIPLGVAIKAISWGMLSMYWPGMATPENWWPYSGNIYYFSEVFGSLIILGFGSYLISREEQQFFRHGLIADSSLIFLAAILVISIIYKDVTTDYFSTITFDNFLVRLQILPFLYYFFVSIALILTLGRKSGKGQQAYFICIIPFSVHVFIEAYANYVFIPPEEQLIYARISASFYYLAAISIVGYIFFISKEDIERTSVSKGFKLSPLIWVAGAMILTAPPGIIFFQQFFSEEKVSNSNGYIYIFIASIAIFIRFSMLILQAQQQQKLLNVEASRDELTGIYNRRGFLKKLSELKLSSQNKYLLCLLDVDTFKSINDTYGHHVGDQVLCSIADTAKKHPEVKLAGRLGGDEFVLVLEVASSTGETLENLHKTLSSWLSFDGQRLFVGVSIGATYFDSEKSFPLLYTSADSALYQAKNDYSGTVLNTSEVTSEQVSSRFISELIQDSIEQDRLCLQFQPIYNLKTGRLGSIEVLMRLYDQDGKVFMPSQFMAMAQKHNKILPLTRLLLKELSRVAHQLPDVRIAINFPPAFFENSDYLEQIMSELDQFDLVKSRFSLEITEEFNSDVQQLSKAVLTLKEQGYFFALDDFGSGSASLSRLALLPVDVVKVDISLLRAAEQGQVAPLESIVALAKRLNSKVVIEGIETSTQLEIARSVDADMGQGFIFSKPVELKELLKLPRVLPDFLLLPQLELA